ncbi:M48 family metalloprotease [Kitasatospora nipponensis]|uniref:M48 family metalloprotease n=1 Tax=Kitasatospora nipponensis TaxID=258049 RepID=UPI0031DD1D69
MGPSYVAPFATSAALAGLAPYLSRRLPARPAAWSLVAGALVAASGWIGGLALLAFTGLGQIRAVANQGPWSVWYLQTQEPVSRIGAGVCGTVLLACAVLLARASWQRGRVLVHAHRQCRQLPAGGELAVVEDPVPDAFALPGAPGRVVVSTGMLRAVSSVELEALLAHERAHLHHRHHLFLLALRLAAAACPLLHPLAREGAFAIERWADEEGARAVGDRTAMARALARAALAGKRHGRATPLLGATGGPVPRRMRSLLSPLPRIRRTALAAGIVLAVACCLSLVLAAHTTEQLFETAMRVYVLRHPAH